MPADEDIGRVPHILGDQMTRKQIVILPARAAFHLLNPEVILRLCDLPGLWAIRLEQMPDLFSQVRPQRCRRFGVSCQIQILNFLPHNPPRHRIDVRRRDHAPEAICLHHRSSPSHERIEDVFVRKIVSVEIRLLYTLLR